MGHDPDNFIAGLVEGLEPVRPMRQREGVGMALLAMLIGVAGMLLGFGMRPDLAALRPDAMFLLSSGLFLVLALASAWAALDMARPFVGGHREGWGWTALMAAVLPLAALVEWAADWMGGSPTMPDGDGWHCMAYGLGWGLVTALALVLWLRRGAPSRPHSAGMLAGVAAGSAGIFAVTLYCPHNDLLHIGFWHGLSVVLAGIAGRLAIPPLVRW